MWQSSGHARPCAKWQTSLTPSFAVYIDARGRHIAFSEKCNGESIPMVSKNLRNFIPKNSVRAVWFYTYGAKNYHTILCHTYLKCIRLCV
jgi:hypothetical protein